MKYKCLSIVSPSGSRIASGEKIIEVRSWVPDLKPNQDLLIIENERFLKEEDDVDPNGKAVALVNVKCIREFTKEDIELACASYWSEGYYSWELVNIRPVQLERNIVAKKGIYTLEIESIST